MIDHPPAIIQTRPALDLRLHINGEQVDNPLPRDFLAMPAALRGTVHLDELRSYLPTEYRLVPDGLLADLVYANLPGFPGALMAGTIKKAWLCTTSGQFRVPGDWNKRDNVIHALGGGANGRDGRYFVQAGIDFFFGGSGGGGAAWAALFNHVLAFGALLDFVVAPGGTSSAATWFAATDVLLADSGSLGESSNDSSQSGGASGKAAASVGDQSNDGGNGDGTSGGSGGAKSGGRGGGAGGPHGAGAFAGDAGQGGAGGGLSLGASPDGGDGVDGPAGGFGPKEKVNAGSGGGGQLGFSDPTPGGNGGLYGGAGGGGGVSDSGRTSSGGQGKQGCLFMINNTRA